MSDYSLGVAPNSFVRVNDEEKAGNLLSAFSGDDFATVQLIFIDPDDGTVNELIPGGTAFSDITNEETAAPFVDADELKEFLGRALVPPKTVDFVLTTTGSGPATLEGNVLNIPEGSDALSRTVVSDAAYTLLASDDVVLFTNDAGTELTIPAGLPSNYQCTIVQIGGAVTLVQAGTLIRNLQGFSQTAGPFAVVQLLAIDEDVFVIYGDVAATEAFMNATGGTITTDGDYKIHTFTAGGSFVVSIGGDAELLVVGAGGGGSSGGGGGGQVLHNPSLSLAAGSYSITIGAGGDPGSSGAFTNATNGASTLFDVYTAVGGGGGGGPDHSGLTGASGGGSGAAGSGSTVGGAGSAGYAGGNNMSGAAPYPAGGGGGAGSAGANGTGAGSGNGGNGVAFSITGSSVYYGGGGGGACYLAGTDGTGGLGGGGNGAPSGAAGTANSGGGGGGSNSPNSGGGGGSGIVIVRYKFQ